MAKTVSAVPDPPCPPRVLDDEDATDNDHARFLENFTTNDA